MKKTLIALAAAGSLMAGTAQANSSQFNTDGMYIGVNYGINDVKISGADEHFNKTHSPSTLGLTIGKKLNDNFGIEGVIGLGISDSSKNTSFLQEGVAIKSTATIEVENYFGAYAVGFIPLDSSFELFAKAGVARVTGELAVKHSLVIDPSISESHSSSESKIGLSYGIGAAWNITEKHGATLEYVKMPDIKDDGVKFKISSINIGYRHSF